MAINEYDVIKRYMSEESMVKIGTSYGVNQNAIRRILIKNKIPIRTKAEAQKLALAKGNAVHPTEGKVVEEDTKIKISEAVSKKWAKRSKEDKDKFAEDSRKRWDAKTEEEKDEFLNKANEAIRESAKEGSKLEKYIFLHLKQNKHEVIIHHEWLYGSDKTHLDIFLPVKGFVIEIDGPSHFLPIWGEDALKRTMKSDNKKRGLILDSGLSMIRVKQMSKHVSDKISRDLLTTLLDILNTKHGEDENYFEVTI